MANLGYAVILRVRRDLRGGRKWSNGPLGDWIRTVLQTDEKVIECVSRTYC